jgi:type IV secretory pathway VirJ component
MKLFFLIVLWISSYPLSAAVPTLTEQILPTPMFGEVYLYYPKPNPGRVAVFLSGDGGWNQGVVEMARKLASQNTLVAGVNIVRYLKTLAETVGNCSYPAADFEMLSQSVQKKMGFTEYISPVLIGYSSGATLVYATIAQSPSTTFRGAISLGFCPDLLLTKPFCRGSGLEWVPGPKGKGYSFLPAAGLKIPWVVLQGETDQVCNTAVTEEFVSKIPKAKLIRLPKVGHGFSVEKNWMPQFSSSFSEIADRPEVNLPVSIPAEEINDLPLIVSAADSEKGNRLAVFLTGDGGWGVTDQGVCQGLASNGIPAVALNSLKYFWKKRTPESAAEDLQRILRYYLSFWKKEKAVLIGYSMGADVLPFMINRLPGDLQDRIDLITLLGPSVTVEFEFHFSNWFTSGSSSKGLPVLPELQKLHGKPILAFYGAEEPDSLCKIMDPSLAHIVQLKGGHRIRGNYGPVLDAILKELK